MYATGGMAVRPYVDMESGELEFSWALANSFYPLRSNSNGISAGIMKSVTMKMEQGKEIFYTHLEFYEWEVKHYVITNELYKSHNRAQFGKRVPLNHLHEGRQETTK